jgi:hypothetical protein
MTSCKKATNCILFLTISRTMKGSNTPFTELGRMFTSILKHCNWIRNVKDPCGLFRLTFKFCTLTFTHKIHTEIANKMQQCIKIYYSMFICSSTCFGWHTTHHQELKTALVASGFAYLKGCGRWGCWMLTVSSNLNVQQSFMYAKPEAISAVLSSWWWVVCRPKHVELYINME